MPHASPYGTQEGSSGGDSPSFPCSLVLLHWCLALLSPEGKELEKGDKGHMSLLESEHYGAWQAACPVVKAIDFEAMQPGFHSHLCVTLEKSLCFSVPVCLLCKVTPMVTLTTLAGYD